MLNVQGIAKVTNLKKVSDKLFTGDVYTLKTVNDEVISTFFKAKLIGKSIENILSEKIVNKTTIEIKNAILDCDTFTTKEGKQISSPSIVIFELNKYVSKKEEKFQSINDDDLMAMFTL